MSGPDAGQPDVSTSDASTNNNLDAFIVMSGEPCQSFKSIEEIEALGVSREVAEQVMMVLSGDDCSPVYISPAIPEDCRDIPSVVPVESNLKFKGSLFVLKNAEGYNLQDGEMLYSSFQGVCEQFPNQSVMAVGVELKPIGNEPGEIQARIEKGAFDELLLRIHVWQGNHKIVLEGEELLEVAKSMQVLLNPESGEILELFSVDPEASADSPHPPSIPPLISETQHSDTTKTKALVGSDGGCNVTPVRLKGHTDFTPLFLVITLLLMSRSVRDQIAKILKFRPFQQFFVAGPKKK